MELPTIKVKASRINPKTIILFSNPKTGKTTAVAALENNLIIDLEDGSEFLDALKINVLQLAEKDNKSPLTVLKDITTSIKEANDKKGGYVYKYITLDTATALEKIALDLGNILYRKTPMGRNWQGDDVTKLPNGAGYQFLYEAMRVIIDEFSALCDTLIILGHLKTKLVEKEGKEMEARGLALTGKFATEICSTSDAIGYMYREDNKTLINFAPSESLVVGTRSEHLTNKTITIIEADKDNNLVIDWSKVFLDK